MDQILCVCMCMCACVCVSICLLSVCLSVCLFSLVARPHPAFGKERGGLGNDHACPEIFVLHGYSEMILTSHNLVPAS